MKKFILLAVFCLITIGAVAAQEKGDDVQRKGSHSLQQSEKRWKLQEGRRGDRNWGGRSTRMWGRNETPNQGRRRPHCRCQVQNFRMWQRNSFVKSRYGMDKGQEVKRGEQNHQRPDRGRTKPSSREDSLQRPSRGRNKSRNKRLPQ